MPVEAEGLEGLPLWGLNRPWTGAPACPSRVRKRRGEFRPQDRHPPGLGQLQPLGTREGKSERQTQETKQGNTKAQEESQQWGKWERERDQHGMGRGHWGGTVQKGPHGQGGERKKRQRTREGKQRGSGSQFPLTPASMNFGVAVVTASKGQG